MQMLRGADGMKLSYMVPGLFALVLVGSACGSFDEQEREVVIQSVEPSEGTARGGDTLTVRGSGFGTGTMILFGDREAASVKVISSDELEVVTPMHVAGAVDVVATDAGVEVRLAEGFSFSPLELSFRRSPAWYLPSFGAGERSDAVAADVDGDGDTDLIVAVRNEAAKVLLNSGAGSFAGPGEATPEPDAGSSENPEDAGDDAVALDAGSDADAGSSPSVEAGVAEPVTTWVHDTRKLLASDFDGDGSVDLFLCNGGGQASRIMLNDGTGRFDVASKALPDTSDACRDALLTDIDGDGDEDIVVLGAGKVGGGASYLRVYLRKEGDVLGFELADELEGEPESSPLECSSVSSSGVTGAEAVTSGTAFSEGDACCELKIESADADASVDLWFKVPSLSVVPESMELDLRAAEGTMAATLILRDAKGEVFEHSVGTIDSTSWKHVTASDMDTWMSRDEDGDGVVDAPISAVGVAIGPQASASGAIVRVDAISLQVSEIGTVLVDDFERRRLGLAWDDKMTTLAAGDLDGDGTQDLLVAGEGTSGTPLRLLLNDSDVEGTGGISLRERASDAFAGVGEVVAAACLHDVDEDGDLDAVVGTVGGQDRYFTNDGTAHFFDDTLVMMPVDRVDARAIDTADLDLDGRLDLLIANEQAVNRLYVSRGAAGFRDATPAMPLESGATRRLVPLDADGDGDLDVFVLDGEEPELLVSVDEE